MGLDPTIRRVDLAKRIRRAIDDLRPHDVTLDEVHEVLAEQLGYSSAVLATEAEFSLWLGNFTRVAIRAWRAEREKVIAEDGI